MLLNAWLFQTVLISVSPFVVIVRTSNLNRENPTNLKVHLGAMIRIPFSILFKTLKNLFECGFKEWSELDGNTEISTEKALPCLLVIGIVINFTITLYALALIITTTGPQKKNNFKRPPGPKGLPFIGSILSLDTQLLGYFTKLAQTYGPIFKVQLGTKLCIVVSSPSMAREILKTHETTFTNRAVPAAATAAVNGGRSMLWTSYGPEWRMLRKVSVLKMLSNSTLDSTYVRRRREVRKTVKYIYNRSGTPVKVGEQMFLTVLNVITDALWGETVDWDERASLGAEFKELVSSMTELLAKPNVSDFFPGLAPLDLQGIQKKMLELTKKIDLIFERMINQKLLLEEAHGMKQQPEDFLQSLLQQMEDDEEEDSKTPLTMTHIKALLMDMVVGGTDTSSNTIEYAFAEIMSNPSIMKKVQQELDVIIGRDKVVEEFQISRLTYLQAVMKETLRLHPPLPLLIPHCSTEACTVGGYGIPKGSSVFVNVWAIHRDPTIWENPTEFNPARFFNIKCDFSGGDFKYLPFGSGRRICPGTALTERLVLFSLATLMHSFDWKLRHGEKILDMSEKGGFVMKKKIPLVAMPTPRLARPNLYE